MADQVHGTSDWGCDADDVVQGVEHEADAKRFLEAMKARLEKFSLALTWGTRHLGVGSRLPPLPDHLVEIR